MAELQPPPMPQKPILIGIIVIMLGMAGIIILLATVSVEKYEESKGGGTANQSSISDTNPSSPNLEQEKIENIEEDVKDPHYRKQLVERTKGSTDESEYLKQREKGFWYVVFPLIIIIIGFVIWVYKKHKEWIN